MPARRCHDCLRRGSCLLLAVAMLFSGCRVFRGQRVSDESVADARRLSLQGLDAQQRGQWERSESLFAAAILKCPGDERAHSGFAEALWRRGAADQAISQMEEAVKLSSNEPERVVRLGQMYQARGDWNRAQRQASLAIAADPQLASAWALQGHVQMAQGQASEALASFHRALGYQPLMPDVQLAVAELYRQANRPQRALATLQSLASSYPAGQVPTDVLVGQAAALQALARNPEAEQLLAQAARRDVPANSPNELARAQFLSPRPPPTTYR